MRTTWIAIAIAAACAPACKSSSSADRPDAAATDAPTNPADAAPPSGLASVNNIVVIYAENHSFDNLFGTFPGANGIPGVNVSAVGTISPQLDRDGTPLPTLPQTWTGVTAAGFTPVISQQDSDFLDNAPYSLAGLYPGFSTATITRDLYHRFFENQMQIHGGANDQFAAYADSGGLVMGYYDSAQIELAAIAAKYTLADNFFMGAFGGSFLNHQYLICGCAPEYPGADTAAAKPTIAVLDPGTANLTINTAMTEPSALDSIPVFTLSGNITPANYFGDNKFYAVNTMQPPFQPSGNAPAAGASALYADPGKPTTLPPQTAMTIGDQLTAANVTWTWYSGAWASTLATATGDRNFPPSSAPGSVPNFQFHHQPFNYYTAFDPMTAAAARTAHLKDYTDLMSDITAGTLPAVTFYKPEGDLNQHNGYASVGAGDHHIAQLIAALEASPQFAHMVVIITYDENGGYWDHVAPPSGDLLGPGTRIPAIIVSPFAKAGVIDHTQYDTGSIARLISKRFGLTLLPGFAARDAALVAHGGKAMGDLTAALDLAP